MIYYNIGSGYIFMIYYNILMTYNLDSWYIIMIYYNIDSGYNYYDLL